jgi:hypothetical protein
MCLGRIATENLDNRIPLLVGEDTLMTTTLTAAEAAEQIKKDDYRQALAALREEKRKLNKMKERVKKQQTRFDKAVALAVSSRPGVEEWYAYAGPLYQMDVKEALGLKSDDLHALMKRYRKRTV